MNAKFDGSGMVLTQCCYCRHLDDGGGCPAFPGGIPDAITTNDLDHRRPAVGDHGIRFEPRDDVPPEALARIHRRLDAVAPPKPRIDPGVAAYLGLKSD